MTINYVAFEDAIEAWFETVTGLTAYWENRRRKHERKLTFGKLNILTEVSLGDDEVRRSFDGGAPNGEQIEQIVSGNRLVTVSVRVKSRSQKADQSARYYLGKLRTSLADPARLAEFRAASIAVVRPMPLQNLDFTEQDRVISFGNMDVIFATVVNDDVAATTYIESALISSDIKNVDGTSLPAALQLDNLEVP